MYRWLLQMMFPRVPFCSYTIRSDSSKQESMHFLLRTQHACAITSSGGRFLWGGTTGDLHHTPSNWLCHPQKCGCIPGEMRWAIPCCSAFRYYSSGCICVVKVVNVYIDLLASFLRWWQSGALTQPLLSSSWGAALQHCQQSSTMSPNHDWPCFDFARHVPQLLVVANGC